MTSNEVRIDRLGPGDRDAARRTFELLTEVFEAHGEPLSDGYIDRLVGRPDLWVLTATVGGRIVGGLTAHELLMTRNESVELFIYDLAVHPGHQRRGIGRRLVETALGRAAARGIECTFVPADDDDAHALAFYRALGGASSPVTFFQFGPT